jgi:hypothetical protein
VQQADWLGLAAMLTKGKGTAGVAGSFLANSL